jgi:hypothetical protein
MYPPNWPPYPNYPFQGPNQPTPPFVYIPVPVNSNEEKKGKKSWMRRESKKNNPFKDAIEFKEAYEEFVKKYAETKKEEKKDDKKGPQVRTFNMLEMLLLLTALGPFVGMAWKYAFTHMSP